MACREKGAGRIPSGGPLLDEAIGGFPAGRTVLVTGDAGSGKTVLGLQFARSCCAARLRTVYLTTEEDTDELRVQAESFGWDLLPYEKEGLLTFVDIGERRALETEASIGMELAGPSGSLLELVERLPKDTRVLVLDSLGTSTSNLTAPEFRDQFDLAGTKLRARGVTALVILDSATSRAFSEVALFLAYGAICLLKRENPYTGRRERVMDIVKIRNSRTPIQLLPFEITQSGLELCAASGTVSGGQAGTPGGANR